MTYWQMDDKFLGHHKTVRALRAGAEALQMWIALRSYVANNESDGFIPDEDIDDLPGAPKEPRRWLQVLVECGKPLGGGARGAGLVDSVPDGWSLHNYAKHGLMRAQIEAKRAADRARKERWNERHSGTHAERRSDTVPDDGGTGPRARVPAGALPSHPLPSQDHTHTRELLAPTPEHEKLGATLGLDVVYEFARFKDQAKGKGRLMVDQAACFALWLRDEAKKAKRSEPRASTRGGPPTASDEDLRRARNLAIENAVAGRYGPKALELAKTLRGAELTALADRLTKTPPPPIRLADHG
jgi:hypothetical protein